MNPAVRLVSISRGADFEIDLSAFPETGPRFAYVDDLGTGVTVLHGLAVAGEYSIRDQAPFMWLKGTRQAVLLETTSVGRRNRRRVPVAGGGRVLP